LKVITEAKIRAEVPRGEQPEAYYIEPGYILSPAAREYLMGRQIKIVNGPKPESVIVPAEAPPTPSADPQPQVEAAKYVDYATGACYFDKPVHMTILYGNVLVPKDHPQIIFRGKLESLQAQIVLNQTLIASGGGSQKLIDDLSNVLNIIRRILRSHILSEPLQIDTIFDLTPAAIREQVKDPMRYFKLEQIEAADYTLGLVYGQINQLRTLIREVEIAAVTAFREGNHYIREDILEALNLLSSALQVMMFRYLAGEYR